MWQLALQASLLPATLLTSLLTSLLPASLINAVLLRAAPLAFPLETGGRHRLRGLEEVPWASTRPWVEYAAGPSPAPTLAQIEAYLSKFSIFSN